MQTLNFLSREILFLTSPTLRHARKIYYEYNSYSLNKRILWFDYFSMLEYCMFLIVHCCCECVCVCVCVSVFV